MLRKSRSAELRDGAVRNRGISASELQTAAAMTTEAGVTEAIGAAASTRTAVEVAVLVGVGVGVMVMVWVDIPNSFRSDWPSIAA